VTEQIDARERSLLCDLVLELGPDAPTLCEGWTTADLTAHLVLREHFRSSSDDRRAAEKAKGLPALVGRLRAGAPLIPWRLPYLRTLLNGSEFFIHHEDVRRANGRKPRTDIPDIDALTWRTAGLYGRPLARRIRPYGLTLVRPDGAQRAFGSGPAAIVRGRPTEIILFLTGRRSAAEITVEGADEAVAAIEGTQSGR
jgi:uncharacterized protein (TIGR03085 family)